MIFEYNEYLKIVFFGAICMMLLSIAILVGGFLYRKNSAKLKSKQKILIICVNIMLSIFFFSLGLVPFTHGIYLVNESESDKIEYTGEITSFKRVYGNNKYVFEGKNTFAYYIFIDNQKYYIMHTGDLEIGDKVSFEYLPKSKIILSIVEVQ